VHRPGIITEALGRCVAPRKGEHLEIDCKLIAREISAKIGWNDPDRYGITKEK
jgi:hypothetical protein